MALTGAQKAEIRKFLGYSDASAGSYSLLEGRMNALSPDGEAQAIVMLADLDAIEDQLRSHWTIQKAKKVEEIELWGYEGLIALQGEGDRLVRQLANLLGVEIANSPFGSGPRSYLAGRG